MPSRQRTRAMAADPLDVVLAAVRAMPRSGRYGQDNVFISSVWDRVKRSIGMSENQFKDWLVEQNRKQNLALVRADLIDDMDPVKVERSEIRNLGAQFHFIIDRDSRRRAWPEMAMHPTSPPGGSHVPKIPTIPTKKMEQDIERVRSDAELYYPGGSGGGGRKRSRGEAGAVVLPHARTSPSCKLCTKYHTTAEHRRHDRGGRPAKAGAKTKASDSTKTKTKARRVPAKKATPKKAKAVKAKAIRPESMPRGTPVMPAVTPALLLAAVRDALPRIGADGRFGTEKVFVSAIWHMLKRDQRLRALSFDQFKRWLIAANRDGDLRLARADLVGAMNPRQVAESEISHQGATFHFVIDEVARGHRSAFRAPVAPVPVIPSAPSSSDVSALVMDAVRSMPSSGRFGRKVFISEIWDRVGGETGMSFEKFRKWLLEANRDGVLVLARADLVGAMNPEMVRKSEISDRGATFHFVLDPDL